MSSKIGFSTTLWGWFGQEEYKRVLAVCEAIPALEFLAMGADEQREAIPYCPACEAWSMTMLPLSEALTVCGTTMPSEVRSQLQHLWLLCNDLSEDAFHCDDWFIFDHSEWHPLRDVANELLRLMGLLEIKPYLDDLTVDCRKEVYGRNV